MQSWRYEKRFVFKNVCKNIAETNLLFFYVDVVDVEMENQQGGAKHYGYQTMMSQCFSRSKLYSHITTSVFSLWEQRLGRKAVFQF